MKVKILAFICKDKSEHIRDFHIITKLTGLELQKEINKILKERPIFQENIKKSLYIEVARRIIEILIYKGLVEEDAYIPKETYEIFI